MADVCSRCGEDLPASARFCPRCGASTEAPVSAERKIVSVLFADLTDSTKLASALDPERFREVQAGFFRAASECLSALRGRVEKFAGDAVMAVFGMLRSHDDDALRAVRAAWEIQERAARLSEEFNLPTPLQVRVGVASGPAVVGAGPADQLFVSGATVNLAARLQQAAEPGEILVGETTRQLTAGSIAVGESRAVQAKGFDDPVTVWPVVAMSERSARRTIPLVGRRRELTLLTETLGRARETSRLHLVTLIGEPGIGKSRLIDYFTESLGNDVRVLRGRVSRFEEDAPFAPLADMIRGEMGSDASSSADDEAKLLRALLEEVCRPEEVEHTASHLELALGIGPEQKTDRPYRVAMVRSGLVSFLECLSTQQPVVLTIDEMELARPELLELVEQLAARARRIPVLLLCVGRDEMLETRPGWGGGLADASMIRLEPLPPAESIELARAAGGSLDDETAERVARHAGGNPFFIVETTGMLLHDRADPGASPPGDVSPPLPATVQAVVAARIDHLDPHARDLVRKASVFARSTFNASELAIVADDPSDEALSRLEDEELLVRDRQRPEIWRFNHEVVRDVAYDSLPKRERLRLHLALADRLVSEKRYPGALAYHLERAARASLDLDPTDRAIAERAADALLIAGDNARRRMELRTAIDLYERGLALGGPEDRWQVREAHMLCGIGEACYWLAEFDRAREELDRALRFAPEDRWTCSVAHRYLGDIDLNIGGDLDSAERHFDKALPAARELSDEDRPFALARTLLIAGWAPYMRHDFQTARQMFEVALETARANPDGDPWAVARALTFIANTSQTTEPLSFYKPLLEEALAVGRKANDPFTIAVAEQSLANAIVASGDPATALTHIEASVAAFRELGAQWETASAMGDNGEILGMLGRPRDAEAILREAVGILKRLGDRQLIGFVAPELAMAVRAQGRHDEAHAIIDEAAAIVDLDHETAAQRAKAFLAYDAGDRAAAEAAVARFIEIQAQGVRPNGYARAVWFANRLLGPEAAGGEQAVRDARKRLMDIGWTQWLEDPSLPDRPLT
jgi:class 3 adenylate cyclase/tetratricopeptide (TPR) repeat protein